MTKTKTKNKPKKRQAEARITEAEIAIGRSVYYRGYHLEDTKDGTPTAVIIRRVDQERTTKSDPVIYRIDAKPSMEAAKAVIDKTAKRFGHDITEVNKTSSGNGKVASTAKNAPTKSTTTKKKVAKATNSATNLNQLLKDKGLWQKGMQFLSGEEKQRLLDGDKSVLKVLEKKLKAIAAKAKK